MRTFNTIDELQNETQVPGTNEVIYVKGNYNPIKNGGGHFVWESTSTSPDDGGMVIAQASAGITGRWLRINYDEISVKFFGARGAGDPARDDAEPIQAAIDFAADQGGGVVLIPEGTYYVTQLILKTGVSIKGEFAGTKILPFLAASGDLIVIDSGPVVRISIEDLFFLGRSSDTEFEEYTINCFHIEAKPGGSAQNGGLWESSFKNIRIHDFGGHGVKFTGGGLDQATNGTYTYNLPNQFNSFENVRVIRGQAVVNKVIIKTNRALLMQGQNGQFTFADCTFSGKQQEEENNGDINVDLIGVLPASGIVRTGPSVINFNTCTSERSLMAIRVSTCYTINITGCWFENLKTAIQLVNENVNVNISKNRFSNSSNYGVWSTDTADGYILSTNSSKSSFADNLILGGYAHNSSNSGSGGTVQVNPNTINHFSQNNYRKTQQGLDVIF